MKIEEVSFLTKDGLRLEALLAEPEKPTQQAVLFLHGILSNYRAPNWIETIGKAVVEAGYAFLLINDRGHDVEAILHRETDSGSETVRGGTSYAIFEEYALDVASAMDYLTSKGYEQVALGGHSLGSNKSLLYVLRSHDPRIKTLALLSPVDNAAIGNVKGNTRFKSDLALARELVSEDRGTDLMPAEAIFFPISAQTYLSLFDADSLAGALPVHEEQNNFILFKQIPLPMLITYASHMEWSLVGRGAGNEVDRAIQLLEAQHQGRATCWMRKIEGATHEYEGYEQQIAQLVVKWLRETMPDL